MGTQWARKQAHSNELATAVESGWTWLRVHQQTAVWTAIGVIAAILLSVFMVKRHFASREEAWSRLAYAQSFAYTGHAPEAMSQIQELGNSHPSSPAAGYAMVLAGDLSFEQGKYKEAAESYKKVADNPQHKALLPLAKAGLTFSQEAGGDCQAAIPTAQAFLETDQDHVLAPQVHASLARCFAALGQADKAKSAYERMVFLYPDTYWSDWAKARAK